MSLLESPPFSLLCVYCNHNICSTFIMASNPEECGEEISEDDTEDESNPLQTSFAGSSNSSKQSDFVNESMIYDRSNTPTPKKPERIVGHNTINFDFLVKNIYSLGGVFFLISFTMMYVWNRNSNTPDPVCRVNLTSLSSDFTQQQPEIWNMAKAILLADPTSVKTMVLVHTPDAADTARCLADQLAHAFSCNKTDSRKPKLIKPDDLMGSDDYGEFVERYKEFLNGALVVHNLNEVNKEAALVFHTLCDDITPGAPPTLIIFTLPISKLSYGQPSKIARAVLENAWEGLSFNHLDPLLSRILGYVTIVRPEDNIPCVNRTAL